MVFKGDTTISRPLDVSAGVGSKSPSLLFEAESAVGLLKFSTTCSGSVPEQPATNRTEITSSRAMFEACFALDMVKIIASKAICTAEMVDM
jgi:hypothetical protein